MSKTYHKNKTDRGLAARQARARKAHDFHKRQSKNWLRELQ